MILFLEKNNALCPERVKDKQTKKSNKVSSTPSNNVVPPLLNELPLTLCKWREERRGVVCFDLRRTNPFEDSVSTILLPIVVALSSNTLNINCFHVYVRLSTRY